MLKAIDGIVLAMTQYPLADVMREFDLSPRDFTLLVKLGYFTDDEIARFGLQEVKEMDVI